MNQLDPQIDLRTTPTHVDTHETIDARERKERTETTIIDFYEKGGNKKKRNFMFMFVLQWAVIDNSLW